MPKNRPVGDPARTAPGTEAQDSPRSPESRAGDAESAAWRLLPALVEPLRLRLLAAVTDEPLGIEELARRTGRPGAEVTRHLGALEQAGWVRRSEAGGTAVYALDLGELRRVVQEAARTGKLSGGRSETGGIRRRYFAGDRIRNLPARPKDWKAVLEEVIRILPSQPRYAEAELNRMLDSIHPDFCTLRRELVDFGFMDREAGIYRLTDLGESARAGAADGVPGAPSEN